MRTSNASLSDPFDSSPVLFPESTGQVHEYSFSSRSATLLHAPTSPIGSWKYKTKRTRRTITLLAALFSLGVHATLLLGFNTKRVKAPRATEEPLTVMLMKMPPIPEDPDDTIEDVDKSAEAGVDVPRQADFPTTVILDNMVTQTFDPRSLQPNLNVAGTKFVTIPSNVRIGGTGGRGIKDIFNLADLDRAPSAVFQPPPNIPPSLRQAGGNVKLIIEFIVNNKGEVVDARVLETTDRQYDDVAIASVLKWRFKPGMKRGRPVAVRIHQPFLISINGDL